MFAEARQVTIPLHVLLQWDDDGNDRQLALDLFDAFGSTEKPLHANMGGHTGVPHDEGEPAGRFFARHLNGEDWWMDLLSAERRLQAAQRDGDVDSLDALPHPRVVGAGPDGTVFTKEDDLASYRSGTLRITSLVEESVDVQEDGQTGVTRTVAAVEALSAGAVVSARLRYTRLWVREDGSWRVLAATFVPVV